MPILCRVTRGELTESIHVGFAAAVDESGKVFYSTGDAQHLTCIRSALKPFSSRKFGSTLKFGFTILRSLKFTAR